MITGGLVRRGSVSAQLSIIFVAALCSVLLGCGGGGSGSGGSTSSGGGTSTGGGGSGGTGGGGGSGGNPPATTLSCEGFPTTTPVFVNGSAQIYTKVCLILQESAQVTPALSVTANVGNLAGHGDSVDMLSMFAVYARIVVTAADEVTATARAKSVVINTANGSISSMPDQLTAPEFLEVDFEVFTQPGTNLTLTSNKGNQSANNYNATLQLSPKEGNVALSTVQGQVTVDDGKGNIDVTLSGSSWTGTGMTATTKMGNITVSRPAGFQAAFSAKTALGDASIDDQRVTTAGPPQPEAVVTTGSGAPINLESQLGNVSVVVAQ